MTASPSFKFTYLCLTGLIHVQAAQNSVFWPKFNFLTEKIKSEFSVNMHMLTICAFRLQSYSKILSSGFRGIAKMVSVVYLLLIFKKAQFLEK